MPSQEELNKELKKDALLRKDVQRVSSMHAPIVYPAAFGILSGGTTTGKHVFSQKNGNKEKPEEDHEEGTSINVRYMKYHMSI